MAGIKRLRPMRSKEGLAVVTGRATAVIGAFALACLRIHAYLLVECFPTRPHSIFTFPCLSQRFHVHKVKYTSYKAFRRRSRLKLSTTANLEDDLQANIYDVEAGGCTAEEDAPCEERTLAQQQAQRKNNHVDLPPWLDQYHVATKENAEAELRWLEYALVERGFGVSDMNEIIQILNMILKDEDNSSAFIPSGVVDFCRLLLTLQDEPFMSELISKEVIIASIIHYSDCIDARRQGIHDVVRSVIFGDDGFNNSLRELLPSGWSVSETRETFRGGLSSLVLPSSSAASAASQENLRGEHLNVEAQCIADGCARLKRAEIVAQSIRAGAGITAWTPVESSRMRGLLLSVMDDWRSLAIRCVASLYRLEGITRQLDRGTASYLERTPEIVQTAREAMRVYAMLAQRMGMHRLKARIEERAFGILYRRQHRVVSALYRARGDAMLKLCDYLQSHISNTLLNDDAILYQAEDLQITSRVKEPYSFWKKLLKKKKEYIIKAGGGDAMSTLWSSSNPATLSVTDVQDGIALRIILKCRKITPNESDEKVKARERLLCYYAQHLIRSHWPEIEASRVKDYIEFPKSNSYQSLHHTSSIYYHGMEFPFEIQIRSEEMHRKAEFGLAAHFDYKSDDSTFFLPSLDVKNPSAIIGSDLSLPQIKTSSNGSSSYLDALVHAKQDLMTHIFVTGTGILPDNQGTIVTLPNGSCVKDAVTGKTLDPELIADLKVWRNGKLAQLKDQVESGDVLSF